MAHASILVTAGGQVTQHLLHLLENMAKEHPVASQLTQCKERYIPKNTLKAPSFQASPQSLTIKNWPDCPEHG